MPDYNIYLHLDNADGRKNPTKPFKVEDKTNTKPFTASKDAQSKILKAINVAQNPDGVVSSALGTVAKAIPVIAVAFAVVKLADKVANDVIDFYTIGTGDYAGQRTYNNVKAGIRACLTPFSTTINYVKMNYKAQADQLRVQQETALLGDSIINSGINNMKGV